MSNSTIVFVGNGFRRQMIDEHKLFPADMMKDYVALHEFAEYHYGTHTFRLVILPDRVILGHRSDAILSEELVQAAKQIGSTLTSFQTQGSQVTGLGFNLDTLIPQMHPGVDGRSFCSNLADADKVRHVIGSEFSHALHQIVVIKDGIRNTIRIEPDNFSGGENLFLSINGHQDVNQNIDLLTVLGKALHARIHFEFMRESVSRAFQGEQL